MLVQSNTYYVICQNINICLIRCFQQNAYRVNPLWYRISIHLLKHREIKHGDRLDERNREMLQHCKVNACLDVYLYVDDIVCLRDNERGKYATINIVFDASTRTIKNKTTTKSTARYIHSTSPIVTRTFLLRHYL